jgi:hypothetical protein
MTKVIRVFSSENKDVGTISTIKGESLIFFKMMFAFINLNLEIFLSKIYNFIAINSLPL